MSSQITLDRPFCLPRQSPNTVAGCVIGVKGGLAAHQRHEKTTVRALRNLAKDIARNHPGLAVPSAWLIRCLVKSYFCAPIGYHLPTTIKWTLAHIARCSHPDKRTPHGFTELDGTTSLFPNAEGFTLKHTHVFACLLLKHANYHSPTIAAEQKISETPPLQTLCDKTSLSSVY